MNIIYKWNYWNIQNIFIEIAEDTVEGKAFLKSEYNKDGDSYRSPWTNTYFPPIELGDGDDPEF